MSALLDSLIDPERRDAIAANAEQLGECSALRLFDVKVKEGSLVVYELTVYGTHSVAVAAQFEDICDKSRGQYVTASPFKQESFDVLSAKQQLACVDMAEAQRVAADVARDINKGPKLAARNDAHALDLQRLDVMRRAGL